MNMMQKVDVSKIIHDKFSIFDWPIQAILMQTNRYTSDQAKFPRSGPQDDLVVDQSSVEILE